MKIQKASIKDIPIIQCLAKETWPSTFADILSVDQIAYMIDMMYSRQSLVNQMNAGHQYILVLDAGRYLGYLSYQCDHESIGISKIHKIYVHPQAQKKGVGRFLIQAIEQIVQKQNIKKIRLNVNRNNTAIQFYENMNFRIVSTEDIDIGNGFLMEDYVMEKELI